MRRARRPLVTPPALALVAALVAFAAAAPGAADLLVLRDGARVETRGPWEVRGRQVVFTLPNGTLSSLRAEEVDLEASRAATAAAEAAAAAPEPAPEPQVKRAPVLVLTEADIPPMSAEEIAAQAEESGVEEMAAAVAESRLEVTQWQELESSDQGITIGGTVHNASAAVATNIEVVVMLYDREGGLLATSEAALGASSLQPEKATPFRASFPGVFNYGEVRFDLQHVPLATRTTGDQGATPGARAAEADDEPYDEGEMTDEELLAEDEEGPE
ncbi:MAG TPA: FxLYD domain-containing protein [Thermoanaerobaculia bacterium]|nr:FxLYD domain-containing protein [Thermoanaerobaculia bacterium]